MILVYSGGQLFIMLQLFQPHCHIAVVYLDRYLTSMPSLFTLQATH